MPGFLSTTAFGRLVPSVILVVTVGVLGGCDTITGNDEDITGTWVFQGTDFSEYLVVSDTELTVYSGDDDQTCFDLLRFEIVSSEGDTYTVRQRGTSNTLDIVIRRAEDDLELFLANETGAESTIYRPTDTNVSDLEICTGGGADPSLACTELPQVTMGESVNGSLSSDDDATAEGAFYDLYGLQLSSATQVQIDLSSTEIDSFLYVYEADGTYLAENDDAGGNLNSTLTLDLDAGCYRLEATSYDGGETGAYTLQVN